MGGEGLKPGQIFAGYRVERRLGVGGVGEVYLVVHPQLNKRFALKLLLRERAEDPQFAARFIREMQTVAALDDHPNIVASTNAGITDGRAWLVMQYVDGRDGVQALTAAPSGLPPADVVAIAESVASALDYAHHRGFVHRDVKPANIMLGTDGRVFLTDFGIARAVVDPQPITTDGVPLTWGYASPEQIDGKKLDGRSDQYSLGCTIHTLLTGMTPFEGLPLSARANNQPSPPSLANARLPVAVDDVIASAMATDPTHRYPDCSSFAGALRSAVEPVEGAKTGGGAHGTPSGAVGPAGTTVPGRATRHGTTQVAPPDPTPRRSRRPVIFGVAAVLVIAAALLASQLLGRSDSTGSPSDPGLVSSPSSVVSSSADSAAETGASPTEGTAPDGTATAAAAVVPLESLLDPTPPTRSGTSGDQPVAGAAAIELAPHGCPDDVRTYTVDVGAGLSRITGTFLMSDTADPTTRTTVTVNADGATRAQKIVAPRAGVTIDVDVTGARNLSIELATAGSGDCTSGAYLIFLTNAQAFR